MAVNLDWVKLSLGELSWTLFSIGVAIAVVSDTQPASELGVWRLIPVYFLAWLFGIAFLRFVKRMLKPKTQSDFAGENTVLGLSWWNTGGPISNMPVNGGFSAFVALWSINAFITLVGAVSFFLIIVAGIGLSLLSGVLLFSHYSVLTAAMFYSLHLLIKKKAAAVPFTQILISMLIASQFAFYAGSRFWHILPENLIVGKSVGGLIFIYYLYQSKQIQVTFPPYARKLFWFDKVFLILVGIFFTLHFLGSAILPDIAEFMTP